MKHRLLVMNGQRLVQIEREGQWVTEKVEKAEGVKPGIYNLYLAVDADKAKSHEGITVHMDQDHLYQQIGKGLVRHLLADFNKIPDVGINASINYSTGAAATAHLTSSRRAKHRIS